MIYFTADTHFNHKKIIQYCNRPFKNLLDMHREIENHYNILKDDDLLYHLGDYGFWVIPTPFTIYRTVYLRGNHDNGSYWMGMPDTITIKAYNYQFHLSHRINDCIKDSEYDIYLCGHAHDKWKYFIKGSATIINVGVDQWNFAPVSLKYIISLHKQIHLGRLPCEQ